MGLQLRMKKPLPRIRPVLRPLAVCAKHLILSPERRLHGVAQPEYSPQTQETKLRGERGGATNCRGAGVSDPEHAPHQPPPKPFAPSSPTPQCDDSQQAYALSPLPPHARCYLS